MFARTMVDPPQNAERAAGLNVFYMRWPGWYERQSSPGNMLLFVVNAGVGLDVYLCFPFHSRWSSCCQTVISHVRALLY